MATPGPERAALIRAAAAAGRPEAQLVLGQMLLDGVELPADPRAALDWFTRAAAQHDVMALNMVGRCYDLGWGTLPDKARAAECYRIAAGQGLAPAMYNYATLLALGEGVALDRVAALGWLERASDLGFAKAINFVGSFAEDGWACERDMVRAADCYRRAAEGGDFRGAFNHARILAEAGEIGDALGWMRRAVDTGTPAFAQKVARWLLGSGHPAFRAFGATLAKERGC